MQVRHLNQKNKSRTLKLEQLENRQLMAGDLDDSMSEARSLSIPADRPAIVNDAINPGTDVDMYRFSAQRGQTIEFDIDTLINGPGGLGSHLRVFNANGTELAYNNDAAAPGESRKGFDSYIRYTFSESGIYYVGVSNWNNTRYSPVTGNGDFAGSRHTMGDYTLVVSSIANDLDDSLAEANNRGRVSSSPTSVDGSISTSTDVDMYLVTVGAGQSVDFDIDTPSNGPQGLGSYLRLFNSAGQQLAHNNDGVAPGESRLGFDSFLRYRFSTAGTYYVGVSNWQNTAYNSLTGANDSAGNQYTVGSYKLTVNTSPLQFRVGQASPAIVSPTNPADYYFSDLGKKTSW